MKKKSWRTLFFGFPVPVSLDLNVSDKANNNNILDDCSSLKFSVSPLDPHGFSAKKTEDRASAGPRKKKKTSRNANKRRNEKDTANEKALTPKCILYSFPHFCAILPAFGIPEWSSPHFFCFPFPPTLPRAHLLVLHHRRTEKSTPDSPFSSSLVFVPFSHPSVSLAPVRRRMLRLTVAARKSVDLLALSQKVGPAARTQINALRKEVQQSNEQKIKGRLSAATVNPKNLD